MLLPLPPAWSVYRLLRMGVSLRDQGYDPPPAVLLDWLEHIDDTVAEWRAATAKK